MDRSETAKEPLQRFELALQNSADLGQMTALTEAAATTFSMDELSSHVWIGLERLGYTTLGQVACFSKANLLKLKGIGRTAINELERVLCRHGLRFGMALEELIQPNS